MKEVCKEEHCTGCGLCVQHCPKHCISIKLGKLGHVYPSIDQAICIDCGKCRRICPSLHDLDARYPMRAYAAWAKEVEDYKTSTSGGAASVLANNFIQNSGVVYGCVVQDGIKISHVRIDNKEDIVKLKGSKYAQSNIMDIIPLVKNDINVGLRVLFIGTPCQVAAIKQMYKKQPENLFLVDIICHGVPSNKWLFDYITQNLKINKSDVTSIQFRPQNTYCLWILNQNRTLYKSESLWEHRYKDLFLNTFIDGFVFRDSCYTCHYAKPQRISDITLGDFWGLGKDGSEDIPDHPFGVSCILPNTEKGELLIKTVYEELNIYERPIKEAIDGNDQLRTPKRKDWRIILFRWMSTYIPVSLAYRLLIMDRLLKYKLIELLKK